MLIFFTVKQGKIKQCFIISMHFMCSKMLFVAISWLMYITHFGKDYFVTHFKKWNPYIM